MKKWVWKWIDESWPFNHSNYSKSDSLDVCGSLGSCGMILTFSFGFYYHFAAIGTSSKLEK